MKKVTRKYKKKLKPIPKIWDMSEAAIQAVIDSIKPKYPDSAMLARYEKELDRRAKDLPLEDIE